MTNYDLRNLVLAVIDDDLEKTLAAPYGLVDLLAFEPTHHRRVHSLEIHGRNIARHKRLRFDLCSIDMNFQEDIDDPTRPVTLGSSGMAGPSVADPTIMTASGLYHGLALLARREPHDDAHNAMPLAWEVRSATPRTFASRSDLRADAIRGYVLLRAFLAEPQPGETLEDCVRREHRQARPMASPLQGEGLLGVIEADLMAHDPSSGLVREILEKLLPRWRMLIRTAIERREVAIHIATFEQQVRQLAALPAREATPIAAFRRICVPLRAFDESEVASAIRLSSIMADLVASGTISIHTPTPRLDFGTGPQSVLQWCEELLSLARAHSVHWPEFFRDTRIQFQNAIRDQRASGVGDLWQSFTTNQKENRRFFLYILMRSRLWMTASDDERDPNDRADHVDVTEDPPVTLSSLYGLTATEQTYRRPGRENRLLPMTPTRLRGALRSALQSGTGPLVSAGLWEWMAPELFDYFVAERGAGGLGLREREIAIRAPGLGVRQPH
jgi:hypothetical protein